MPLMPHVESSHHPEPLKKSSSVQKNSSTFSRPHTQAPTKLKLLLEQWFIAQLEMFVHTVLTHKHLHAHTLGHTPLHKLRCVSSLAVGGLGWSRGGKCFVESTETTCSRQHDLAFHSFYTSKTALCLERAGEWWGSTASEGKTLTLKKGAFIFSTLLPGGEKREEDWWRHFQVKSAARPKITNSETSRCLIHLQRQNQTSDW